MLLRLILILGCTLGAASAVTPETLEDPYGKLRKWLAERLPGVAKASEKVTAKNKWLGLAKGVLNDQLGDAVKDLEAKAFKLVGTQLDACLVEPKMGRDVFPCTPGADKPGPVRVLFVNGVWTDEAAGKRCATALAEKLGTNVDLVYNPGAFASVDDLRESAMDKAWPLWISRAMLRKEVPQDNPATRHLAWILLNHPGPIALVTHSQGCIIARNAVLTAALRDVSVLNRISWVAVASPLRTEEYLFTPAKFREVTHANDLVAQQIGRLPWPEWVADGKFQFGEIKLSDFQVPDFAGTHGFREAYLATVDAADLSMDSGKREIEAKR